MRRFLQVLAVGFAVVVLGTLVWLAQSRAPTPEEALAPEAPSDAIPAAATVAPPEHLPSTKMIVMPIEVDPEFLPSTKSGIRSEDFLPSTKAAPLDLEFLPSTKADAGAGALLKQEASERLRGLGTTPPRGGHTELERQEAAPQVAP